MSEWDLEELDPEDAEDDEEGAADEDDVADGLDGGEEGLDHQLQPGSSVDHPEQQYCETTNRINGESMVSITNSLCWILHELPRQETD